MIEDKIVLKGEFEDVIERGGRYFTRSKKDLLCIIPYTISEEGLLDKIGIVELWNDIEKKSLLTLIHGYLSEDDGTNLVGANRIFFQNLKANITDATKWMYLGSVFHTMVSDSPIRLYCIDVSGMDLEERPIEESKIFKLFDVAKVLQTDDLLFLGGFTRLFNYFYIKSL